MKLLMKKWRQQAYYVWHHKMGYLGTWNYDCNWRPIFLLERCLTAGIGTYSIAVLLIISNRFWHYNTKLLSTNVLTMRSDWSDDSGLF